MNIQVKDIDDFKTELEKKHGLVTMMRQSDSSVKFFAGTESRPIALLSIKDGKVTKHVFGGRR